MGFRSLALSAGVLLLLLLALGGVARADDIEQLQREVTAAENTYKEAIRAETRAAESLKDNLEKQKSASDAEKARLKSEAVKLDEAARKAGAARMQAAETLADKRGALRAEASKVAEEQITAQGDANNRTRKAGEALGTWSAALGALPGVPTKTDTSSVADPAVCAAIKQDDKARFNAYISWAGGEQSRLDTEIKRAENLIKNDAKFAGADGHKRLMDEAKSLKSTLENRKKDVGELLKTARERLASLDR